MRAIFCGNFGFDTRQSDLERLFGKYGRVDRVDMKSGFAFVSMDDERDAKDAIRGLDQTEFGRQGRRLRVDWTKQERGGRKSEGSRSSGNSRPTRTLFVINFDPVHTRTKDLEKHFDPYGKILSIRIRKNFAFIQYDLQEDATKALDATNMSKLMDQVVSVEYALRDDDGRSDRHSPNQGGCGRSAERSRDTRRSPRGQRDSPDYGHGPSFERSRERVRLASPHDRNRDSPDYGRAPSPNTKPEPRGNFYQREKDSPDFGHGPSPKTRPERRGRHYERERDSPDIGHCVSPNTKLETSGSPDVGNGRSSNVKYEPRVSTRRQERDSPDFGGRVSPIVKCETRKSARGRERDSPDVGLGSSPNIYEPRMSTRGQERDSTDSDRRISPNIKYEARKSTRGREGDSPDVGRGPSPNIKYEPRLSARGQERDSPDSDRCVSPHIKYGARKSTREREGDSPDFGLGASPPITKPEPRGSPKDGRTKGPGYDKRHRSRSPSRPEIQKKQKELTDM